MRMFVASCVLLSALWAGAVAERAVTVPLGLQFSLPLGPEPEPNHHHHHHHHHDSDTDDEPYIHKFHPRNCPDIVSTPGFVNHVASDFLDKIGLGDAGLDASLSAACVLRKPEDPTKPLAPVVVFSVIIGKRPGGASGTVAKSESSDPPPARDLDGDGFPDLVLPGGPSGTTDEIMQSGFDAALARYEGTLPPGPCKLDSIETLSNALNFQTRLSGTVHFVDDWQGETAALYPSGPFGPDGAFLLAKPEGLQLDLFGTAGQKDRPEHHVSRSDLLCGKTDHFRRRARALLGSGSASGLEKLSAADLNEELSSFFGAVLRNLIDELSGPQESAKGPGALTVDITPVGAYASGNIPITVRGEAFGPNTRNLARDKSNVLTISGAMFGAQEKPIVMTANGETCIATELGFFVPGEPRRAAAGLEILGGRIVSEIIARTASRDKKLVQALNGSPHFRMTSTSADTNSFNNFFVVSSTGGSTTSCPGRRCTCPDGGYLRAAEKALEESLLKQLCDQLYGKSTGPGPRTLPVVLQCAVEGSDSPDHPGQTVVEAIIVSPAVTSGDLSKWTSALQSPPVPDVDLSKPSSFQKAAPVLKTVLSSLGSSLKFSSVAGQVAYGRPPNCTGGHGGWSFYVPISEGAAGQYQDPMAGEELFQKGNWIQKLQSLVSGLTGFEKTVVSRRVNAQGGVTWVGGTIETPPSVPWTHLVVDITVNPDTDKGGFHSWSQAGALDLYRIFSDAKFLYQLHQIFEEGDFAGFQGQVESWRRGVLVESVAKGLRDRAPEGELDTPTEKRRF